MPAKPKSTPRAKTAEVAKTDTAVVRPSKTRVLENFIQSLHDMTGLNISFVDMGGFTKLKKFKIDEEVYGYRCRFCKLMASSKKGIKRCMENDKRMMQKALDDRGVVIQRCHAGLIDMMVPIMAEDQLLGFIFAGQVMDREVNDVIVKQVWKKTEDLGHTQAKVKAALKAVPVVDKATLRHAANLITMVAGYIASTEQVLDFYKQVRQVQGNMRMLLVSHLVFGSAQSQKDFDQDWKATFSCRTLPRALVAVKLGDYSAGTEHLSELEKIQEIERVQKKMQEGIDQVETPAPVFAEYVGAGLFCAVLTGNKSDKFEEAMLKQVGETAKRWACKVWTHAVYSGIGGQEGEPATLYRAFNRAILELDKEEHPQGRHVIKFDEMEDSFTRSLKAIADAVQFGMRDEARNQIIKALNTVLSGSDSDRQRRSLVLEVFHTMRHSMALEGDARNIVAGLIFDVTEMVVRAREVDQEVVSKALMRADAIINLLPEGNRDRYKDLVKRVKAWLDNNLKANTSLKQLAGDFGIGQYNLSRIFRKETGTTIKNYLANRRVEESQKLLTQSSMSIAEIAEKVGFHDFHYYCLVFKKLTGTPPGTYRKKEESRRSEAAQKVVE